MLSFPLTPYNCAVILNGHRGKLSLNATTTELTDWQTYQKIVVVDGAWNDFVHTEVGQYLQHNHPERVLVLGDGDSIQTPPAHFIHTPDQNYTDFEKSISFLVDHHIASVDVYWGSGGEMDHFLGNLSVVAKYAQDIYVRLIDDYQCYVFLQAKKTLTISQAQDKTVSIYPFPEANLKSNGLAYPLVGLPLSLEKQQSLRNRITTNTALLTLLSGAAWVFISF